MKDVHLLETVEQPVVYPSTEGGPVPINQIAQRGAYATTHSDNTDEDGVTTIREAWKIPTGSEISLPDKAADTLVALGYAELIAPAS
jgi:hypothetical protein